MGTEKSPGTKLFCVSGPVKKPGVFERPLGYPLKKLIFEDAGGMIDGKQLKAVIPGGASAPVLLPAEIETLTLDYEAIAAAGSMLGSGAVMVIPHDQPMMELLRILVNFFHHESCGQCTPCREGTGWLANIVQGVEEKTAVPEDIEKLYQIALHMEGRTICALSDAAAMPTKAITKKFADELKQTIYANSRLGG